MVWTSKDVMNKKEFYALWWSGSASRWAQLRPQRRNLQQKKRLVAKVGVKSMRDTAGHLNDRLGSNVERMINRKV